MPTEILPSDKETIIPARPEPVYVERDGVVATIVLNQPGKHNAVSLQMWREIPDLINALSADNSLRCVVLRGAGEEAFSSGCDIGEFANVRSNTEQGIVYGEAMEKAINALFNCRHPLVAQVHGLCMGAGVELLATCDIRICGESSTFGVPAKNLGLVLSHAELEPIFRLVGENTLMEMLLEGRIFSAEEAREKKLITRVFPDEEVAEKTAIAVKRIISGAPLTARWHKHFVRRLHNPASITPEERAEGFQCYDTEDYRSGCAAFLLRDTPIFKGK